MSRPSALRRRVSPRSASVCSETCRSVNSSRAFTGDGHRVSPEKSVSFPFNQQGLGLLSEGFLGVFRWCFEDAGGGGGLPGSDVREGKGLTCACVREHVSVHVCTCKCKCVSVHVYVCACACAHICE